MLLTQPGSKPRPAQEPPTRPGQRPVEDPPERGPVVPETPAPGPGAADLAGHHAHRGSADRATHDRIALPGKTYVKCYI